ncbi:MAG TPA: TonB-dependent receptor [Lutibacter sp.]|nr:TonB-dependent receptor [Lutibacter sp.]
MYKNLVILLMLFPVLAISQSELKGMVMTKDEAQHVALEGASVYWLHTDVGTMTNEKGNFSIPFNKENHQLIISYIGYKTDTLDIHSKEFFHHLLIESNELDEVIVKGKKSNINTSYFGAHNLESISEGELLKAACCSLSESFETNPSIDVSFTDAVTGTKQIQMLGLTSPYIQLTQENIPAIRGAAQVYGMSFIPGTWVKSIQITKGAGSVINGFESITGQINTELKKPDNAEKFFLNLFGSLNGRMEFNTHANTQVKDKLSTGIYAHVNMRKTKIDANEDGFLDSPLAQQINILNRWKYYDGKEGWHTSLILRYLNDEKQAGQTDFNPDLHKDGTTFWGSEIKTKRYESYFKLGKVNPDIPYQSFGYQAAYSYHNQDSYFGLNKYDITHSSFYTNALFQSILSNTYHQFKTGISYTYDNYQENLTNKTYSRTDQTIGGFFEYNFDNEDKLSINAGLRADYHNHWGFFLTPRIHIRYQPYTKTTLRLSGGRGKRTANIFAENQKIFATNRTILITPNNGSAYGLQPETAWNYGFSFLQGFQLFERKGDITLDFYRTDFENQVVIDYENPQEVSFYNLNGQSFANSLQLSGNYELMQNLDMRIAYKYYDVQTQYKTQVLLNPLQAKNRFFVNLAYHTTEKENGSQWLFDYTFNWVGEQRLPNTESNPLSSFKIPDTSPSYTLMNTQITRNFNSQFSIYLGGENLTGFTQEKPIFGYDEPFGENFDSSLVYAPIHGQMFYVGLRYGID